jgi:hypothetical protein
MGVFGLLVHYSLARNLSQGTTSLFSGSQEAFVWLLELLSLARMSSCLVCYTKGIESPLPSTGKSTSSQSFHQTPRACTFFMADTGSLSGRLHVQHLELAMADSEREPRPCCRASEEG